jgi:ATP-binding cassette subfamily B protein
MKDRTTFVIAHRLSTIRNATLILVFEGGHIVESGGFNELVARGGAFAELAKAQFLIADQKPDKKAKA